mgnify:CR=1 FL=1
MKLLLAFVLVLSSSIIMAIETPTVHTQVSEEFIALGIENNDAADIHCTYKISWLENVLTYINDRSRPLALYIFSKDKENIQKIILVSAIQCTESHRLKEIADKAKADAEAKTKAEQEKVTNAWRKRVSASSWAPPRC